MTADPSVEPSRSPPHASIAGRRGQIRYALVLPAVAVAFFLIGATAPKVVLPYACKVYG